MVGKTSSQDEEKGVADKRTEGGRDEGVPQHEDLLVREEATEDGSTFTLRDATEKDGKQPILFDEMMDRVRHEGWVWGLSRSSIRFSRSAICAISSRMPMIWLWRNSSSFSCSAMISISALRLTS